MPRSNLSPWLALIACVATCLPATAKGDEPSPRVPPTMALPGHHPITRATTTGRDGKPTAPSASAGGFWLSSAGIAVAIAAFGAFSLGARKLRPGDNGPLALKVVGRTSLSPKHTVYLLKAGNRVLIVGAGGQGPPSLLGELTEAEASNGGAA